MKRFVLAMLFVVCVAISRPASACPVAVKAIAANSAAVVAIPVESAIAAPVVVETVPVVAVPTVSVVAVPAVVEQVVKVKVKAKRKFRTPVRRLLFR